MSLGPQDVLIPFRHTEGCLPALEEAIHQNFLTGKFYSWIDHNFYMLQSERLM